MTGHKFRRPDAECISHAELLRRFEYVGKAGLRRKDSRRGKTGNVNTTGYVRVQIDGKSYLMHRLVWFYHHGQWPIELNHKKRNKQNNAIENLESCTRKENQIHALGKRVKAIRKGKTLKTFRTIEDAVKTGIASRSAIFRCLSGKQSHAGGMRWVYA